ncbi:MAG: hypothetical protein JNJ94_12705 [Chlorobi bacterium]|nr:hypothetical protein [Chlorobiota bacterium]
MFNGQMTSTQRANAEVYALQIVEGLKANGVEVTGANFNWMVNDLPLPLTFKAHNNQQRYEALNGGKVVATVREFTTNKAESFKETKSGLEIEAIVAEIVRVIEQDGPVLQLRQQQLELMEQAAGKVQAAQQILQSVHEGAYVVGSIAKTDNGKVPVVKVQVMGLPAQGVEVFATALAQLITKYKENAWASDAKLREVLGLAKQAKKEG